MTRQIYIVFSTIILLTACATVKNRESTVKNREYVQTYFNIDKVEIHTLMSSNQDTICKTNYEIKYNLPGRICKVLIDTNNTMHNERIGIYFKIYGKPFTLQEGVSIKGYPIKDTAEVMTSLTVSLIDFETGQKLKINDYLSGDSIYNKFKFINWWSSIMGNGMSDGCCNVTNDIPSINMLIDLYNNSPSILYPISNFYFIFWIDNKFMKGLIWKPDLVEIEIETLNKRTKTVKRIINEYKINAS